MKPYKLALLALVVAGSVSCGGEAGGDGGGGSPTSPTGSGTGSGSGGCTRPGAPTNVAAAVSATSVMLTWSAVSGANDYMVLVGTSPGTSNQLSTNTSQTNYNWNGVPRGTYYVRVEARNTCGSSASSSEVTFTIS